MHTFMSGATVFLFASPTLVLAQAGSTAAISTAATSSLSVDGVSHISGSIYPTVTQPNHLALPSSSASLLPIAVVSNIQAITSACLTSLNNASQCQASIDAASEHRASYEGSASYEETLESTTHMAFCNVESSSFSGCLAHYASVLVKRPIGATRTLSVVIRDMHGVLSRETVLASPEQTDEVAAKLALADRPYSTVVSVSVIDNDMPYTTNTFSLLNGK